MVKVKSTCILSGIIAILVFTASFGGLVIDNLYRDKSEFILSAWYGNDLVTLFVALPLFIGSLIFYSKGSLKGHLIWLGLLDYCIYNFAFYLFGAALNYFFPIYVLIFTLSIFALVFGMIEIDVERIRNYIKNKRFIKLVSIYMLIWVVTLTIAWTGQWFNFCLTGELPQIIISTGGVTNLVAALDLSFVVSVGILAAIWIWKGRPFGYVLAVISNVKGTVYTIVLILGSFTQGQSGVDGAYDLLPLWLFFFIGCFISTLYLLKNNYNYKIQLNKH